MTTLTQTLRFRWEGELPRVGHFLKAPRGRNAYEILEITFAKLSGQRAGRFKVCRWEARALPPEVTIHEWRWDRRR